MAFYRGSRYEITKELEILPGGILSGEAFGNPQVLQDQILSPPGIASEESFGAPVVLCDQILLPSGIVSEETFGAPLVLLHQILYPSSVPPEESFGTPAVGYGLVITGIPSEESFGIPLLKYDQWIYPSGIPTGELSGGHLLKVFERFPEYRRTIVLPASGFRFGLKKLPEKLNRDIYLKSKFGLKPLAEKIIKEEELRCDWYGILSNSSYPDPMLDAAFGGVFNDKFHVVLYYADQFGFDFAVYDGAVWDVKDVGVHLNNPAYARFYDDGVYWGRYALTPLWKYDGTSATPVFTIVDGQNIQFYDVIKFNGQWYAAGRRYFWSYYSCLWRITGPTTLVKDLELPGSASKLFAGFFVLNGSLYCIHQSLTSIDIYKLTGTSTWTLVLSNTGFHAFWGVGVYKNKAYASRTPTGMLEFDGSTIKTYDFDEIFGNNPFPSQVSGFTEKDGLLYIGGYGGPLLTFEWVDAEVQNWAVSFANDMACDGARYLSSLYPNLYKDQILCVGFSDAQGPTSWAVIAHRVCKDPSAWDCDVEIPGL